MARNVICCETALRLELRAERKCPACVRNGADDPLREVMQPHLLRRDKFPFGTVGSPATMPQVSLGARANELAFQKQVAD